MSYLLNANFKNMVLAPICLFTYNRLTETKLTIEALQKNFLAKFSDLIIFSDGPKNQAAFSRINEIRQYLNTVNGFKNVTIIESQVNNGLANSIIEGVTEVLSDYGKVIVMEDDLISSPNFLNFMNQALEYYKNNNRIQSINGYSLKIKNNCELVYFQTRPFPWGWATWNDRWNKEIFNKKDIKIRIEQNEFILKDFKEKCGQDISKMLLDSINGRNDSWYVRWTFDHFIKNSYSVFPKYSFIQNIGHNSDGTHCKGINPYETINSNRNITEFPLSDFILPSKEINKDFLNYFSIKHKLLVRIKLLRSNNGRQELIEDLKIKLRL